MENPVQEMAEGHYHFRTKLISRSDGRAICAAAAYRSGEKIRDEHYGKTFDYTPRTSIYSNEIRAPDHAPEWMKNRAQLWNGVEAFETRKNSRLAREFEVSIPRELTAEQRQAAIRSFVDKELVARGMVADIAYHDFTGKHRHNPHAHILVTTREIDGAGFSKKKTREWDKEETLMQWREAWAKHANHALEQAKLQTRIDHRSHKDRGITAEPLSESQGGWHIRQRETKDTRQELEAVEAQLDTLEQEQAQIRQQRMDGVIQFGNDLARRRAERKERQAEQRREQEWGWSREWEKQQEVERQHQEQLLREEERAARWQREAERLHQEKQQPANPPTASPQNDNELIRQWQEYKERERGKPRASGHQPDQAQGGTLDQQLAKLKESIAAFDAELEKRNRAAKQQPQQPRPSPDPQPERKQEREWER